MPALLLKEKEWEEEALTRGGGLASFPTGLRRCARYAFGPNRLHYCGPDAHQEISAYLKEGAADPGLEALLREFRTMFPYLKLIAGANQIKDPFDDRVVEAYWSGNELLEQVAKQALYLNLKREHRLKERLGPKAFAWLENKIGRGALCHHSFHVLNVWQRTGRFEMAHTLDSLDNCLIKWGRVKKVEGPFLTVETEPLLYQQGKLLLGPPTLRQITRRLEADYEIEQLKVGDIVTIHWGVPCEVITESQLLNLKRYTRWSIALANQTL